MRHPYFTFVAIISLVQVGFAQTNNFKDSEAAENLVVRIDVVGGSTNLSADKKITFGLLEKTNEANALIVYLPKMQYFCEMQLLDSNGIAMPKTSTGEKYGDQFSSLKIYSWESVNKRGHNTGGSDRPDMTLSDTKVTEGRDLPPVQELFKIKTAGNYKLSLQFQVFKRIGNGTNHTFEIVRLPAVEIPVMKSENEK
jgi:hypothetical protein